MLYLSSIVWTPIPLLTWLFPFIGHMGICYSNGIIRDFAGPYYVSVYIKIRIVSFYLKNYRKQKRKENHFIIIILKGE